jgi:hypothetical protein
MLIQISQYSSEDFSYQRDGCLLADKLMEEDEVITSLGDVIAKRSKIELVGIISAIPLPCVLLYIAYIVTAPGTDASIGVGVVGLVSLLASFMCYLLWMKMDVLARLHQPLASQGHLCCALESLAAQSPAVAETIRCATRSGRQLRVFDVARGNRAYEDEKLLKQSQACFRLHSL